MVENTQNCAMDDDIWSMELMDRNCTQFFLKSQGDHELWTVFEPSSQDAKKYCGSKHWLILEWELLIPAETNPKLFDYFHPPERY